MSLLDELYTTPKPGLVDLANCGAHTDMDVPLFEKSAACLKPYFRDAVIMGMDGCKMEDLRKRGLKAEREMFQATGGVNTHKGLIYSMGLLLAGTGRALTECGVCDTGYESFPDICIQNAAGYAAEDAETMMEKSADNPVTHGGKVLREYGAGGAMQEAVNGFPDAVFCADRINCYRSDSAIPDNVDSGRALLRKAGALAFCDIMARLEDTNLLHRGGPDGLDFARSKARQISEMPDYENRIVELREFDEEMISRNLSPGGSADMLALAFYINRLRKITADI
jgi:triphosphoribosyl-dephospho-CoA synthetase